MIEARKKLLVTYERENDEYGVDQFVTEDSFMKVSDYFGIRNNESVVINAVAIDRELLWGHSRVN